MDFAIMRAKKIKTMGSVASALQHCYRERETINANKDLTPSNTHMASTSADEAMGKLRELLPEKYRKDAVLAVEYVLTASPEWWEKASLNQQQTFFYNSVQWLSDKYGKENILTATVHRDELTPHLSAFVVPRTADGRLSAKEFIGDRNKMSSDQTLYAQSVAILGLKRGFEGSRATHQRVKAHYTALEQANQNTPQISLDELKPQKVKGVTLLQKIFGAIETNEGISNRINAMIREQVAPIAAKASMVLQVERKSKETLQTVKDLHSRLSKIEPYLKGLNKEQLEKVRGMAAFYQFENEKNRQQQLKEFEKERSINKGLDR